MGINLDEPKARVAEYIDRVSVRYPIWVDSPTSSTKSISSRVLFQRFGGVGLPTTIFIDRTGLMKDIFVGELNRAKLQLSADELTAPDAVQPSAPILIKKG